MIKLEKIYTYLLSAGLMCILLMVLGIFAVVFINGVPYFWPKKIAKLEMSDGRVIYGEEGETQKDNERNDEIKLKIGNRRVLGSDFVWVKLGDIKAKTYPEDVVMLERYEWGNAYGVLKDIKIDELIKKQEEAAEKRDEIKSFESSKILSLNAKIAKLRHKIEKKGAENLSAELEQLEKKSAENLSRLEEMRADMNAGEFVLSVNESAEDTVRFSDIADIYVPNDMSVAAKCGAVAYRMFEFVFSEPRESNTEGGIFPAIFGTVLLVFLMSIAVFPLGVIAAVFISEYAKDGVVVRLIKNTIYNLAGVPSIVYGVFGLGFFVYMVGGGIDRVFFSDYLPNPVFGTGGILWASLTLAVLTLPVVIVASLEGLKSVPDEYRYGSYSLGATKWEVIKDIVIPGAMPGMLTGLILAISRAAGEVAPLMLTGVVKSAVSLPVDSVFPFVHLDAKFMHLGFHIYDVGFQSPNIEAARPMVFNTTLVLLLIVFALNMVAIIIRNRLRKKFYKSGV